MSITECYYCQSENTQHLYDGENEYECLDCKEEFTSGMTAKRCQYSFEDIMKECNIILGVDSIADREAYNNFTDNLCKEGKITEDSYNTMDNPF